MLTTTPRRVTMRTRPFYASTLCITLLATYALFVQKFGLSGTGTTPAVRGREEDLECRLVHQAPDKCAFIRANCLDDEAGLLPYLTFYYCTLGKMQPVAFVVLVVWLGMLFTTIGIAASDFFSVNLSTIATILRLSESLAGVTFLAFGNGSPDVFSTFAAMGSNSGSMAVGELIGAAGFITAVVAGSMALVREFRVSKKTYVRDICFFIAAVSFSISFLADGQLHLWECSIMIGFYLFYVATVVGWHWVSARRKRRKAKEAASRGHYYGVAQSVPDELEPFRDEEGDNEGASVGDRGRQGTAAIDIRALENGPRIDITNADESSTEDDEDLHLHVAAEMASSMRVMRPRGRRSNTTLTPFRPSLVGALEFRSVLSSLQKERNLQLTPINLRRHTAHAVGPTRGSPTHSLNEVALPHPPTSGSLAGRSRALSSGDMPLNLHLSDQASSQARMEANGGGAAVPTHPLLPRLHIPSPEAQASVTSSPALSPFPGLSESPLPMTPHLQHSSALQLSPALPGTERDHHIHGLDESSGLPKPVRWWPYRFLPPPHVLLRVIFPTLQDWREKSVWDKFVSTISVPSIFLLVITLPVVEAESHYEDDSSEATVAELLRHADPGHHAAPSLVIEPNASDEAETEWQRYRRSTRSSSPHSHILPSPALLAVDEPSRGHDQAIPSLEIQSPTAANPGKPLSSMGVDDQTIASDEAIGWNRWLIIIQMFTGPLFTVFIVWANMREELEQPGRLLIKMILYSLLMSLVLLTVLLATTSAHVRPKYHFLLCFLGFIISVAWISTVAGEVVGVLKAFGVILGISEAILGLTIFAVGNSLGDLVADVTVARLGYPVMALSACFGGPMLNILLGVGIGGAWMTIKAAREIHDDDPESALRYEPYHIEVGGTLIISALTVLITLLVQLTVVPMNNWVMSRKIGFGLIGIWTVSTIINLVVELTGLWKDIS